MTTITVVDDPIAYLTTPTPVGRGLQIFRVKTSCGLLVAGVDYAITYITGFSPLEEYVIKPFGGDFESFDRGADAWRKSGQALQAVMTSFGAVDRQVGDAWSGNSREAFAAMVAQITDSIGPVPDACSQMADFCEALADMALSIIEFVMSVISYVVETVIRIGLEQAVPVAGQAAGAAEAAVLVGRLSADGAKIVQSLTTFQKALSTFAQIAGIIAKVLAMIETLTQSLRALSEADLGARTAVSGASFA